ncbi:hypothetical protein [Celeribacter neptunius]|uniref:Response regulator receiver domain-containing protein n=1 Tax=Celeribacter neptunius TaxID=588602 RepID=A0A1I3PEI3_9RHOB|nr:hypothetical protein [Celeribacter neptunius]SFJ19757.1 hypothetical protein SAMN04487991_1647 [Celeribacter neptunius]
MRVLVWHEDIETSTKWQTAFGCRSHYVRRSRSSDGAIRRLREERFDVLIFDLLVGSESGLGVALMAEFHQPHIVTMLVSSREPDIHSDMFARLSSLRCVLGCQTPADDLVAIAEGFVENPGEDCRQASEILPQICETCHIRAACQQGERLPLFRHREAVVAPEKLASVAGRSHK